MVHVILLAGGSGKRMQADTPKQLMRISGREVIWYSLHTFCEDPEVDDIILVTRKEDIPFFRSELVDKYGFSKVRRICPGGEERYNSVYNGLMAIDAAEDEENIVMIHDGARPFVSHRMIKQSVQAIRDGYTAVTVGMPVKDTIKIVTRTGNGVMGTDTPDRSTLYQIQTPQTFIYSLIKRSYEKRMADSAKNITDDTMLVEQYGGVFSKILEGSYENIKLTTPEDMEIAEVFAKKNP